MTTLLVIRHGESEANRERFFAGQLDAPLLEKGIKQAELTADFIRKNYNISAVYASDLRRAEKTGEIIAKASNVPIFEDKRLREIFAGAWQGLSFSELAEKYKDDYNCWLTDIGNCRTTGGESIKELSKRVFASLLEIAKKHKDETVAIATHATPIRIVECLLKGLPLDEMKNIAWVSNASFTEISYENGIWSLVKVGEDSHLEEMRTSFAKGV